jgi:hypothetical protein
MTFSAIRRSLSTIFCLLLLAGYRRGDKLALGIVHGTVTLDGEPLANARLVFELVEPARASTGLSDANGKYQ